MLFYEISSGLTGDEGLPADEMWRLEFRAPVNGHENVLCWVDNVQREDAQTIEKHWRRRTWVRFMWCPICPPMSVAAEHEHDELPEQRGWLTTEITDLRIMPMREAA